VIITSRANPKVKAALSLRDRRDRDRSGLFLIEGYREIYHALKSGVEIEQLFFCEDLFLGSNEGDLLQEARKEAELIPTSKYVFQKLSYRDRPDGLLAVARKMNRSLDQVDIKKNPLIIIAEAIEKPGNLGTILRSADAAGVDLVIVANGCTDIYNPNVVRASVGTLFTIPVVEAENEEALLFCKQRGVFLLAATPEAEMIYTKAPMKEGVAIIVGTEQLGLSSFWKKACDLHVSIPMHGVADSLNVATATTLILFEVVRQRT
jgi:TrmH family RNA methyltransferase